MFNPIAMWYFMTIYPLFIAQGKEKYQGIGKTWYRINQIFPHRKNLLWQKSGTLMNTKALPYLRRSIKRTYMIRFPKTHIQGIIPRPRQKLLPKILSHHREKMTVQKPQEPPLEEGTRILGIETK